MNSVLVKCLAVMSVVTLVSCAKDLTPYEHITKAREYMQAGEFDAANIELKNAASKDPNNPDARFELANVALALGDGPSAEKEVRRAEDLGMPVRETILVLVKAIYLQSEFDRLLAESEKLPKKMDPLSLADIHAYRAHALIQNQQFRLADAEIGKALKLNEDSVAAVLAKASYEAQVGRRDTAMTLTRRALELDPNSPAAWALLGDLQAADDDLPAARESYDKAISNRYFVSLLLARRALVLAQLKEFDAADVDIELLYENGYKEHPYVNFVRGYIAFQRGDYPSASEILEISVAGNPEDPMSKLYLVASYMAEGKLEQAQMIANQLYYAIPNSVEIARMFASLNLQQQDLGAAKATLSKLLKEQEEDPVALGMLASIALMEGKGDEAIDYLQRLLVVEPGNQEVQSMLRLALTMRGDFVSEVIAAAEQQVPEEEFDRVLLSAGAAFQQGQLKEAVMIAENLQQQYPDRVEPLNMLAAIYLFAGDWRKGKSLLEQTLAIEPMEPSAVKTMAKISMRIGEEERAQQLVSAYLKEHPQDMEAIGIQCELIVATNDYKRAEVLLTELLDKDPKNLEIKARLAKLYFDNHEFERVAFLTENLSDKVIAAQPLLMELRGKALFSLGNTEGATKVWERWIELSPDSVLANFYYADALAKSNELPRALEYLETTLSLNPGYMPARIALIRVTAQAGDMDKAFKEMKKLRSELPQERADVWYTQGWLNARAGKFTEAEKALQKSLDLQPSPDTAMLLFTALNSLGRQDEALVALETWSEKFAQHAGLMVVLGQSYVGRKQIDKAVAVYQRLLSVDPQSYLALNNLAWLSRDTDPEQALEYARRAIALAPEDPFVLSTLGTLLAANGQSAEGEQTLRKAVALHPDNVQVKLDLGRLLLEVGKIDAAKPYLELVIGSTGNEEQVAEARSLLQSANKGGG